jgi:O-antigen ligase
MSKSLLLSRVFATGIAVTPLVASPFVLDFTLTARFIALSISVLLAIYFIYRNKPLLQLELNPPSLFYLSYLLVCILSISWANTKSEAVFDNSKLLLSIAVFFVAIFILKNDRDNFEKLLFRVPVIVFIVGVAVAIYQLSHLKSFDKEAMYEVTGINGHKNLYSSFLFLNLFFLLRTTFLANRTWKIISMVCIVLTLGMIILLRTKAVWIGLSVAFLIFGFLFFVKNTRRFKLNFYLALIIVTALANAFFFFVLPPIIKKTISANAEIIKQKPELRQKTELDNERLVLWDKSFGVFRKHPALGAGMGNWQINFPDETLKGLWRSEDLNYTFQRPHNDLLWVLSETGIIGFNLSLLFLFSLVILALKTIAYVKEDKILHRELILCVAFILGYAVVSFFDFPKERIEHLCWSNLVYAFTLFHISRYPLLPVYRAVKINDALGFVIVVLSFVCLTAVLRYKGEYYTRKMYDYKRLNNFSEVIKTGHRALSYAYSIDPTSLPIAWFTGNARASLGDYSKAQEDLEKAYHLNPYNRNVVNDLASSYANTGNREKAKQLYLETSRISPRFDDAKLNLAAILIQEQKFREASQCLDSVYHDSERRTQYRKMVDAFLQNTRH